MGYDDVVNFLENSFYKVAQKERVPVVGNDTAYNEFFYI